MFFNAGRMGFKHFRSVVTPGGPTPGGDTYCFGLTGTEHVVFGFDNFPVPDKPAFAYIYDCTMTSECIDYNRPRTYPPNNCIDKTSDVYEGPPVGMPDEEFCSCTGDYVKGLNCFFKNIVNRISANSQNHLTTNCGAPQNANAQDLCAVGPEDIFCRTGGPDDRLSDECCIETGVNCTQFGHTFCIPTEDEMCDFCFGGVTGDAIHCGISVPYVSPNCLCTTSTCAEGCPQNSNCELCDASGSLSYLGPAGPGENGCPINVDMPESPSIRDPLSETQGGITPHYCITNTGHFVSVEDFGPGITNTNQIDPSRMINITGNDCAGCSNSAYKAFFAYITYEEGVTFCNLFLTPTISGPCSPPTFTETGCTFALAGFTAPGRTEQFQYPESDYLLEFGCGKGLVRSNWSSDPLGLPFFDETKRIDTSLIDTCGINPCGCSDPQNDLSDNVGFTGGACREFMNGEPYIVGSATTRHYEPYFSTCDSILNQVGADPQPSNTGDLVVNPTIENARTPFAREAVNRIGVRSEELFDLPIISTGIARSFFAPWTDNFIDRVAINAASLSVANEGVAFSVYPASNYHSWFSGPMFDIIHGNSDSFAFESPVGAIDDQLRFRGSITPQTTAPITIRGQQHPQLFGNFITPPGFFGYAKEARENITNRGYMNSWGAVKLNEFYRQPDSVWTGGTLPSFNEVLTNGIEAPPNQTPGSANPSATHLQSNPMGLTGYCGMGWCSMIGRQNCSWLNPRFTVLSNWLWVGAGNSAAYKPGTEKYAGSTYWTNAELDKIQSELFGIGAPGLPDRGFGGAGIGENIEPITGSVFQPEQRVFSVTTLLSQLPRSDDEDDHGPSGLPTSQYPCYYSGANFRPEWTVGDGVRKFQIVERLQEPAGTGRGGERSNTCPQEFNESGGANDVNGTARVNYGLFRDATRPYEQNQRYHGMDRWESDSAVGHRGGLLGSDVVDGIMPSPSILSYYPLNIVGGYLYAGPKTVDTYGQPTVSLSDLNEVTGIGNANGFLYGGFGRDISWRQKGDRNDKTLYLNPDGSQATGATTPDSNQSDQYSSHHAQRLYNSGSDTNSATTAKVLDLPYQQTGKVLDMISNCEYRGWQYLAASHCLLDISSQGISTISSKFAGCTAFYRPPSAGSFPASDGSNATSTYQFNGNGWWYRTHEQLSRGIDECGWTSGIGPAGWVKHEHGWYPDYDVTDGTVLSQQMETGKNAGDEGANLGDNRYTQPNADFLNSSSSSFSRHVKNDIGGFVPGEESLIIPSQVGNDNLNNGWTACSMKSPFSDYQRQATDTHFPQINSGYYPVSSAGGIEILNDTKMFDAVFAWRDGLSAGFGGHPGIEAGGYFTLISQNGDTLQIRATGGVASMLGSTFSDPINLNIRPYDASLEVFGFTGDDADLICATNADIDKPYLGACSRIHDKTNGGFNSRVYFSSFSGSDSNQVAEIDDVICTLASHAAPNGITGA